MKIRLLLLLLVLCTTLFAPDYPVLPTSDGDKPVYTEFLKRRYGFTPSKIQWAGKYPVYLLGGDERSMTPDVDGKPIDMGKQYDAIIVGGGASGTTAAYYLQKAGKRVLLLEREGEVGGLAQDATQRGKNYSTGGAYFSPVPEQLDHIYKEFGLGNYEKNYSIGHPIDSYLWNGKYYHGLWESPQALKELPASFSLFKYMLQRTDGQGKIADVPLQETSATKELDKMNAEEWVRTLPEQMRILAQTNKRAREIYERFLKDPKVDKNDPMKDVIGLLNIYGRSALGEHIREIGLPAFLNFYSSEIGERYTGSAGTGTITNAIEKKLRKSPNVDILTNSPVGKVKTHENGVDVTFIRDGKTYKATAPKAVFAATINTAPKLIENLETLSPEHYKAAKEMEYRNYLVINVHTKGHPWTKTYDLWVRNDATYTQADFTDVIDGRWMDFVRKKGPRTDDRGVLTIYQPLPKELLGKNLTQEKILEITERAVNLLQERLNPLVEKETGKKIEVLAVETHRWPNSIHLAKPNHFRDVAPVLAKPVGNIIFANNNEGVPAIEQAVYAGYQAAQDINQKGPGLAGCGPSFRAAAAGHP